MEFITSIITVISSTLLGFVIPSKPTQPPTQNTAEEMPFEQITYEDVSYHVYITKLKETASFELFDNLELQKSSSYAYEQAQCTYLINGGFYNLDNTSIGWFKTADKETSLAELNWLFNAFVVLGNDNQLEIVQQKPISESVTSGFQTGPLLIYNGEYQEVTIPQDKQARRSFLLTDTDDAIYIGMITSSESTFSGPKLQIMGEILNDYSQQQGFSINAAINLDGGSASAFMTPTFKLQEIKPIGSYLCIRE